RMKVTIVTRYSKFERLKPNYSSLGFFLNISSMRSVTTKPPTTFAEPSTTARKPTIQVNDPVDRVRARHQRRVQQCRHLRDHLEAEEDGEHEDRHLEDQQGVVTHAGAASFLPATHAPAVISSDQSRLSSPSGARCSSSACTLRE